MKNNNRDYTELQLHYLELDEYICENIYPINNIVFTEKINWLTGLAAVGGAVALGFLVKFIWESIVKGNTNQEKINKGKEATKKQEEENKKKKSEVNLNPEQEQKLDKIDKASAAEIKENIIPAFEQSDKTVPTEEISSNNPLNDAQQNNENPINPDKQTSKTVPEKTEEELQTELTKLEQKNKESEQKIHELQDQNDKLFKKIHRKFKSTAVNPFSDSTTNNVNKIISDISSLEKKVEVIEEKQVQIFSQDQHKDLEDKQIDQDKIETKPLPVETIKDNYDAEFNNFNDLYNENMKIINFTFKYISYHYNDLINISIEYNKTKEYKYKNSPLQVILYNIENSASNLDILIYLFSMIGIQLDLVNNEHLNPKKQLMIDRYKNGKEIQQLYCSLILDVDDLLKYNSLDKNPWLNIYIDLFKDENYDTTYFIFKKGTYENIIQKYENTYEDTKLIDHIDNNSNMLEHETAKFGILVLLSKSLAIKKINLTNNEMFKTFIKLRKEQLKAYLLEQAAQQNNQ